jgi:isoquinoline 1-oxidoreductase alpha subunit
LLKKTPHPTDAQITEFMSANICRCGTYERIRRAIHRATTERNTRLTPTGKHVRPTPGGAE